MSRKHILKAKGAFSFLERGVFYWRLLILPFVGAFISFASYGLGDESIFVGKFLSFNAYFYTSFLFIVVWIGSSVRDRIFARNVMESILLWPISIKEKMFWLYLRSFWLPVVFLLLGAIPVVYFIHFEAFQAFFVSLPYGLAAGFFLSIINWKGSYDVVDAGSFVGKISVREENFFFYIFFICLSPIVFDFLPFVLEIIATVFLLIMGFVYKNSRKQEIQSGGLSDHSEEETDNNKSSELEKKGYLIFFQSTKSGICRYFYFLEWNTIKKPLQSLLTNMGLVLFMSVIYYALGGLFSSNIEISNINRGLYISLLLSFSTIYMQYAEMLEDDRLKIAMLLPLSYRKKAVVNVLQRTFLPIIYTLLNIVVVSLVINLSHRGLSLIIPQPHLPFGRLLFDTLIYTLIFLPSAIAVYSLIEFLIRILTVILQALGLVKVYSLLHKGTFFLYLFPLIFLLIVVGEYLLMFEEFLGYPVIILSIGIFLLSRLGNYWAMKRLQVISS